MKSPAWPFVAPFLLFTLFLIAEGWCPDQHYLIYVPKTICVGAVILWFWRALPNLKPAAPVMSVLIGIAGVVLWIGLDPWLVHYDQPLMGRNPFQLYPATIAWMLFGFRLLGISVVVPIMEELFWRGFSHALADQGGFYDGAAWDLYDILLFRHHGPFRGGARCGMGAGAPSWD